MRRALRLPSRIRTRKISLLLYVQLRSYRFRLSSFAHSSVSILVVQLAEALLTLANLTADENTREELYARAQAEGGDAIDLDLDPPATALPAAISAIAAVAKRQTSHPTLEAVADDVHSSARSLSIEASPALMFASSRTSLTMAVDNALGLDQPPMFIDGSLTRREEYMDES